MEHYILKNKPKDECGIFGISCDPEAASLTALGLHALQHRGQGGAQVARVLRRGQDAGEDDGHLHQVQQEQGR